MNRNNDDNDDDNDNDDNADNDNANANDDDDDTSCHSSTYFYKQRRPTITCRGFSLVTFDLQYL